MSRDSVKKAAKEKKTLAKLGIKKEPIIINGVEFNAKRFMLENQMNPDWKNHPDWIAFDKEMKRRKAIADNNKREMRDSGLPVKSTENIMTESLEQSQEMEAYHKSVSSVLATIGALENVKEMTKQQVPKEIWNKAKQKHKLTDEEIAQVPLSKLAELTNIFVKISDAQLKAISKVVDVEGINAAKKEARKKAEKEGISTGTIEKFDFNSVIDTSGVEVIDDSIEKTNEVVEPDKVKDYLARILN